jgi:NTP pyrophosphatase (non-canonical NTP hydrolase)
MKFDNYQANVLKTWNEEPAHDQRVLNSALGLCGEAGEVAELLKKYYFHGKPLSLADLQDELGDVLYYLTVLAVENGFDLTEIAGRNILKLKRRYPDGFAKGENK